MKEKNYDKIAAGGNGKTNLQGDRVINPDSSEEIFSGTVKWFSPEKGFGFVTCSDGRDIFVYYTEIRTEGFKTLQKGQKVYLEIVSGERGSQASNVRPV